MSQSEQSGNEPRKYSGPAERFIIVDLEATCWDTDPPAPHEIIEIDAIKMALQNDYVVIAAGGGGIPVVRNDSGELRGVYAVIDKDRASSLLASGLGADLFVISTGVEKVMLNFNKPDQQVLDKKRKRPKLSMSNGDARRTALPNRFRPLGHHIYRRAKNQINPG